MKMTYLLFLALILSSCATAQRLNRIALGMNKSEVIDQLGDPDSASSIKGKEILQYRLLDQVPFGFKRSYVVVFETGKVTEYGLMDTILGTNTDQLEVQRTALGMAILGGHSAPAYSSPSPIYRPARIYSPPPQVRTNCTTQALGSSLQTNCTSGQSGIDASIYQQ